MTHELVAASGGGGLIFIVLLLVLFLFLLDRMIRRGPEPSDGEEPPAALPDTFREVFRRSGRASPEA